MGDLPPPSDDAERKALNNVQRVGWHVMMVRHLADAEDARGPVAAHPLVQAVYDAEFSYTVGLEYSYGHPEFVLVGPWQHAVAILNLLGEAIRDGQVFPVGTVTDEVLDGFDVRLDAVPPGLASQLLTWTDWLMMGQPFRTLQLVLPDRDGRWPTDAGYDAYPQPSLA